MPVGAALTDPTDHAADLRFRGFGKYRRLFRRGEIEDRSPCIGHAHGVKGVDSPPMNSLTCRIPGCSRRCAIGRDEVKIVRIESCLFKEFFYDARQAPEICRLNDADRVVGERILALPDAVHDGDGFHLPSTVLLSRSTTTISSARMVLYGIPDGFITTSPFSRSIPETFPHVNVTSPYLGKSIFASYTCSFSSSSIVFTRFCLLYPKQDRELKLFFYMRHVSCHTSQNTYVEDKQEKKASSLRITPSEHRHNLRRRSRLLLRSRALRSHRQII